MSRTKSRHPHDKRGTGQAYMLVGGPYDGWPIHDVAAGVRLVRIPHRIVDGEKARVAVYGLPNYGAEIPTFEFVKDESADDLDVERVAAASLPAVQKPVRIVAIVAGNDGYVLQGALFAVRWLRTNARWSSLTLLCDGPAAERLKPLQYHVPFDVVVPQFPEADTFQRRCLGLRTDMHRWVALLPHEKVMLCLDTDLFFLRPAPDLLQHLHELTESPADVAMILDREPTFHDVAQNDQFVKFMASDVQRKYNEEIGLYDGKGEGPDHGPGRPVPHFNGGFFVLDRSTPEKVAATDLFMHAWHDEWLRFRENNQPALGRCLLSGAVQVEAIKTLDVRYNRFAMSVYHEWVTRRAAGKTDFLSDIALCNGHQTVLDVSGGNGDEALVREVIGMKKRKSWKTVSRRIVDPSEGQTGGA